MPYRQEHPPSWELRSARGARAWTDSLCRVPGKRPQETRPGKESQGVSGTDSALRHGQGEAGNELSSLAQCLFLAPRTLQAGMWWLLLCLDSSQTRASDTWCNNCESKGGAPVLPPHCQPQSCCKAVRTKAKPTSKAAAGARQRRLPQAIQSPTQLLSLPWRFALRLLAAQQSSAPLGVGSLALILERIHFASRSSVPVGGTRTGCATTRLPKKIPFAKRLGDDSCGL